MSASELLGKIALYIINPLITLGFVVAATYFFYGIAELLWKADSGSDLEKNKKNLFYGIIGLLIMFGVYGIMRLILNTLKIDCAGRFFC